MSLPNTATLAPKHTRVQMQPENIRAIIAGRKTQTRRLCKLPGIDNENLQDPALYAAALAISPFGQVGDLLCFTEPYAEVNLPDTDDYTLLYCADTPGDEDIKWTPARFMPKVKARLWAVITTLRLERLQQITSEDALAEGIDKRQSSGYFAYRNYETDGQPLLDAQASFGSMWRRINGADSWSQNPVVWVIGYKVMTQPGQP